LDATPGGSIVRALDTETGILWLGEPGSDQVALVGGKAAALGTLAAQAAVPAGFCVTAFEPLRSPELPVSLAAQIREAYAELGVRCGASEPAVAVRSSAVDEDGAHASFAGMHDTLLNVSGADAVLEAVARCAASAMSERALAYRQERGLRAENVRIAVLVQQMIQAEASFVAFSVSPLSASAGELLINAAWGLGESIVSGAVTPDTYLLRRRDREILSRVVGQQAFDVLPAPGGTLQRDLPAERRSAPALLDEHAAAVAELALRLEQHRGHPVDIEGARIGERLFLLQCRPITAAFPVAWEDPEDAERVWIHDATHFPRVGPVKSNSFYFTV
jgi:phosphoenolpyruvate synthase/pyruvate phosphate dikinase